MRDKRHITRPAAGFAMLVSISVGIAENAPPPAAAASYTRELGNCVGLISNWRGDRTTGYAWHGESYAADSDCKSATADVFYNSTWKAGNYDSSYVYRATAWHASATKSRHRLCAPIGVTPLRDMQHQPLLEWLTEHQPRRSIYELV
jgi:hypothetical protein